MKTFARFPFCHSPLQRFPLSFNFTTDEAFRSADFGRTLILIGVFDLYDTMSHDLVDEAKESTVLSVHI